jgi:hypothetical protein
LILEESGSGFTNFGRLNTSGFTTTSRITTTEEETVGARRQQLCSPDNRASVSPYVKVIYYSLPFIFYIGKTVWLYYALRRCLAEKRPVIWCYRQKPYMFVEEGVYEMGKHFQEATYKIDVWTLVDSGQSPSGVPIDFVQHNMFFFVIYATPPVKERWSHLHRTVSETVVVMNPWTRGEIHRA